MNSETIYRMAFFVLFLMLLPVRFYIMAKVHRSGERILPNESAIQREGGRGFFIFRVVIFLALMAFLGMYGIGMAWIDAFHIQLPDGLRWAGFGIGLITVAFWTWTQLTLDTQWSAQLQLKRNHHLVTTGPYARIRHPLYSGIFGWCLALSLLTANWIFVAACLLAIAGLLWRVPREEQMMLEAFGDEYKAYMQHTGRFFPKLWKGCFHA